MKKISFCILVFLLSVSSLFSQNFGDGPEYLEKTSKNTDIRLQNKYDKLVEKYEILQTDNTNLKDSLTASEEKIKSFEKTEKRLNNENNDLSRKIEDLSKKLSDKDEELNKLKTEIRKIQENFDSELKKELDRNIDAKRSLQLILKYSLYILFVLIFSLIVVLLSLKLPRIIQRKKDIQRYTELFYNHLLQAPYETVLVEANSGGEIALLGLDNAKRKFEIERNYKSLEEYKDQFNEIFEKKINNRINNFQEDVSDKIVCYDYCEDLIAYNDLLVKCCGAVKELGQKNQDLQRNKKDGIRQCLITVSDRLEGIILRINSLKSDDLEIKGLLEGVVLSYNTTLKSLKEYIK